MSNDDIIEVINKVVLNEDKLNLFFVSLISADTCVDAYTTSRSITTLVTINDAIGDMEFLSVADKEEWLVRIRESVKMLTKELLQYLGCEAQVDNEK